MALLYFVVGCGGIRGSGGTVDDEIVSASSNKIYKGKISQFNEETNEITINGVQISAVGAEVYRNSIPMTAEKFRAGQIISVEAVTDGKKGKVSAIQIEIEDQLQGPIQAIDLDLNTITILGQTIHVTLGTSFTQKSLKTLKINYYLAVFGFRNEKGVLEATLIEVLREDFQATKDKVKLAGEVAAVDIEGGNIVVEGVEIQLNTEAIKEIKVGDALSLNGFEISSNTGNILSATTAESNIQSEVKNYDINREVVLEGLPKKITDRNIFTLNGYQITVPLEIMNAQNISSVENRKLIVNGTFVGEKEILATDIRVEQIKDFEFRGILRPTGEENSVSIFDKKIVINIYTFVDFNLKVVLEEIAAGISSKTVYAKGYVNSEGQRVATNLSLNQDDKEQFEFIKGKIESLDGGILLISGISIKLNGFVIYLDEDRTVNSGDLLTLLAVGERVEVFGGFDENKVFVAYFLSKKPSLASEGTKADLDRFNDIKNRKR